jgi:hypothetical protein
MEYKTEFVTAEITTVGKIISWLFGLAVLCAGIINTGWGNDTGFGIFLVILSLIYFLPVNAIFKKITGSTIPAIRILKILLGIFIIWAVLGVGELFDKIALMKADM